LVVKHYGIAPAAATVTEASAVAKAPDADAPSLKESLDNLEQFATSRKDQKTNKREFLLHRATKDFEYEGAADGNAYTTKEDSEWAAEYIPAENKQDGSNPVISVWVPEDFVKAMPYAPGNTGTWGDLGKNPNAGKYKITVKPGTYEIHQELRE